MSKSYTIKTAEQISSVFILWINNGYGIKDAKNEIITDVKVV